MKTETYNNEFNFFHNNNNYYFHYYTIIFADDLMPSKPAAMIRSIIVFCCYRITVYHSRYGHIT